ncbi:Uncharacterised protein [BD1-7 clade bacterium]|uniref:Uncharacterized protein n=1 Tax=BD1-7 clade bacterium TaxID=2029982 RepID=A0A5S9QPT7_9GAMM|nr:Uncharacterised protein [BD1-7 clade bacterium]
MSNDTVILNDADIRAKNYARSQSKDIPVTKQFAVNATGNLFIATTLNGGNTDNSEISKEAEEAFGQVSVFFSAMTKAMDAEGKSLYDYDALNHMVSASGLFARVTESTVRFRSDQWGVTIGNELIKALFGMSGNLAAIGKSLMDMISGMGEQSVKISSDTESKETRVGTIVFICEYLLGAVSIVPIILSVDAEEAKGIWQAGPCLKAEHKRRQIDILKSTYLFVPPTFIKYAASLNEAMSDTEFNTLVHSIRGSLTKSENNTTPPPATDDVPES